MRIKHKYGFNNENTEVLDFLNKHQISYNADNIISDFELFEDNSGFDNIRKFMESHNIHPISETIYSQKEIEEAQWLSVRSTWRLGYPQPQDDMQYRSTTYDSSHFCEKCGNGLIQKEKFILKNEPKWNTRCFFMTNWIHDELFVSNRAISILQNCNLNGFSVNNVLKPSKQVMESVKQIFIKDYIDFGLEDDTNFEELICKKCNFKKYMLKTGLIYYNKEVFKNIKSDIAKSKEKFGEITCCSKIFISQNFYRVIKENKLDRGLVFEPIKLI